MLGPVRRSASIGQCRWIRREPVVATCPNPNEQITRRGRRRRQPGRGAKCPACASRRSPTHDPFETEGPLKPARGVVGAERATMIESLAEVSRFCVKTPARRARSQNEERSAWAPGGRSRRRPFLLRGGLGSMTTKAVSPGVAHPVVAAGRGRGADGGPMSPRGAGGRLAPPTDAVRGGVRRCARSKEGGCRQKASAEVTPGSL